MFSTVESFSGFPCYFAYFSFYHNSQLHMTIREEGKVFRINPKYPCAVYQKVFKLLRFHGEKTKHIYFMLISVKKSIAITAFFVRTLSYFSKIFINNFNAWFSWPVCGGVNCWIYDLKFFQFKTHEQALTSSLSSSYSLCLSISLIRSAFHTSILVEDAPACTHVLTPLFSFS